MLNIITRSNFRKAPGPTINASPRSNFRKPPNQTSSVSTRSNFKKSSNEDGLNIHKMRGGRHGGRELRSGNLTSRKLTGLGGNLRKEINKYTIFGSSRKNKYKNINPKNLQRMFIMLEKTMKKNPRPELTKYQAQQLMRKARVLKNKGEFSQADLKDFRRIVKEIKIQSYDASGIKSRVTKSFRNKPAVSRTQKKLNNISKDSRMVPTIPRPSILKKEISTLGKEEPPKKSGGSKESKKKEETKGIQKIISFKNNPPATDETKLPQKRDDKNDGEDNEFDNLDMPLAA